MGKNIVSIAGVNLSDLNLTEVLEYIKKYLENGKWHSPAGGANGKKPLIIFTPNPEIVVYRQGDENFGQIVNSAQINIPDGQGIIWASRILDKPLPERISGTDLMEKLVKMAAEKGFHIGLIGGGPKIALQALECLQKKYPHLHGWAEEGPTMKMVNDYDLDGLIKKINQEQTRIVFVGMGCPKQEYFINTLNTQHSTLNTPLILMSVGGAFDYFSGRVPRAPIFVRKLGLEWLFRLFRQPWRIKRQLALPKFIFLVLKQKFFA